MTDPGPVRRPHPFDPTAQGDFEGGWWPDPIPCPAPGPEIVADDDVLQHPAKTPSLFRDDQDGSS